MSEDNANYNVANTVNKERIIPLPVNVLFLHCSICTKEMPETGLGAEVETENGFLTVCKKCCNLFANVLEEIKEAETNYHGF